MTVVFVPLSWPDSKILHFAVSLVRNLPDRERVATQTKQQRLWGSAMFESVALEAFKTVCKIYESHELLLTASGALAAGLPAGMWIQSLRHRYIFARFTSDFEAVRDKLAAAIAALEKERTRYDELLDYMRADRERQTSRPIVWRPLTT